MRIILFFKLMAITMFGHSQALIGNWKGELHVQGVTLRIVFNIENTDSGISATMNSPDQNAYGILTKFVKLDSLKYKFTVPSAGIEYVGRLKGNASIEGVFNQGRVSSPLHLTKDKIENKVNLRPQEPLRPYPYMSKDVSFRNDEANIKLSGTLSLPKQRGVFPAVVLISGSGAQNRDEEIFEHKPFLVISDFLTRRGIAVLRYDDRGVGESTGNFSSSTSLDFASDVKSAVSYLKGCKQIDKNNIGLIGHSEGGLIASLVASESKDLAFVVLLASVGIKGNELLLKQTELISRISKKPEVEIDSINKIQKELFDIILKYDQNKVKIELTNYLEAIYKDSVSKNKSKMKIKRGAFIKNTVDRLSSPWMTYFVKCEPYQILKNIKCPVLALNGKKDVQVPPKENLNNIEKALEEGGNQDVTVIELDNLNHLFQNCNTGLPNEYSTIQETFSTVALSKISEWIFERLK